MDSESRFVKATFTKMHAPIGNSEVENITNYFHILQSVEQQKGLDGVAPDTFEYTIYSDGSNLKKGIFTTRLTKIIKLMQLICIRKTLKHQN